MAAAAPVTDGLLVVGCRARCLVECVSTAPEACDVYLTVSGVIPVWASAIDICHSPVAAAAEPVSFNSNRPVAATPCTGLPGPVHRVHTVTVDVGAGKVEASSLCNRRCIGLPGPGPGCVVVGLFRAPLTVELRHEGDIIVVSRVCVTVAAGGALIVPTGAARIGTVAGFAVEPGSAICGAGVSGVGPSGRRKIVAASA